MTKDRCLRCLYLKDLCKITAKGLSTGAVSFGISAGGFAASLPRLVRVQLLVSSSLVGCRAPFLPWLLASDLSQSLVMWLLSACSSQLWQQLAFLRVSKVRGSKKGRATWKPGRFCNWVLEMTPHQFLPCFLSEKWVTRPGPCPHSTAVDYTWTAWQEPFLRLPTAMCHLAFASPRTSNAIQPLFSL